VIVWDPMDEVFITDPAVAESMTKFRAAVFAEELR